MMTVGIVGFEALQWMAYSANRLSSATYICITAKLTAKNALLNDKF
jgi:hypothetical protein